MRRNARGFRFAVVACLAAMPFLAFAPYCEGDETYTCTGFCTKYTYPSFNCCSVAQTSLHERHSRAWILLRIYMPAVWV